MHKSRIMEEDVGLVLNEFTTLVLGCKRSLQSLNIYEKEILDSKIYYLCSMNEERYFMLREEHLSIDQEIQILRSSQSDGEEIPYDYTENVEHFEDEEWLENKIIALQQIIREIQAEIIDH